MDKSENLTFNKLITEIEILVADNPENVLSQVCHLLKNHIFHYDWVGFYRLEENELVLGPFAGKPTVHKRISLGKGICGQVAVSKHAMTVQDVTKVDNYLSCSIDVQSEIVVPVIRNGKLLALLDIDSHTSAPFTQADTEFLEKVCLLISSRL